MLLKEYLIETFLFNDQMNRQMFRKLAQLPDKRECTRFFSHLINSQDKWMARILRDSRAPGMSWWEPVYPYEELKEEWNKSLQTWINFLRGKNGRRDF